MTRSWATVTACFNAQEVESYDHELDMFAREFERLAQELDATHTETDKLRATLKSLLPGNSTISGRGLASIGTLSPDTTFENRPGPPSGENDLTGDHLGAVGRSSLEAKYGDVFQRLRQRQGSVHPAAYAKVCARIYEGLERRDGTSVEGEDLYVELFRELSLEEEDGAVGSQPQAVSAAPETVDDKLHFISGNANGNVAGPAFASHQPEAEAQLVHDRPQKPNAIGDSTRRRHVTEEGTRADFGSFTRSDGDDSDIDENALLPWEELTLTLPDEDEVIAPSDGTSESTGTDTRENTQQPEQWGETGDVDDVSEAGEYSAAKSEDIEEPDSMDAYSHEEAQESEALDTAAKTLTREMPAAQPDNTVTEAGRRSDDARAAAARGRVEGSRGADPSPKISLLRYFLEKQRRMRRDGIL